MASDGPHAGATAERGGRGAVLRGAALAHAVQQLLGVQDRNLGGSRCARPCARAVVPGPSDKPAPGACPSVKAHARRERAVAGAPEGVYAVVPQHAVVQRLTAAGLAMASRWRRSYLFGWRFF
jgi:hypothetical protein